MDWGIVASIMVALALFFLALFSICVPFFLLMARRMKKKVSTAGMPGCPMPCGPSSQKAEPVMSQCASQAQ
jgi:cbb3-type cytochrome oxidase subunit 3